MSTCSASKIQDTELLGGRHNVIPSENAGAKHEYTLQTPAQHDFCAGKPKRLLNPRRDDSETDLRESETKQRESNKNQTITSHILPSLRNRYHNLLKQIMPHATNLATTVPRCSHLDFESLRSRHLAVSAWSTCGNLQNNHVIMSSSQGNSQSHAMSKVQHVETSG